MPSIYLIFCRLTRKKTGRVIHASSVNDLYLYLSDCIVILTIRRLCGRKHVHERDVGSIPGISEECKSASWFLNFSFSCECWGEVTCYSSSSLIFTAGPGKWTSALVTERSQVHSPFGNWPASLTFRAEDVLFLFSSTSQYGVEQTTIVRYPNLNIITVEHRFVTDACCRWLFPFPIHSKIFSNP